MFWKFAFCISVLGKLTSHEFFYFEGDIPIEEKPLLVSLGSGCDTAITLRDNGLRYAAFPFDWLVIGNHELFIKIFDNDFAFFTDEKYFVQLEHPTDHPNSLRHHLYEIFFYHEGSQFYEWSDTEKYKDQIERLKTKYDRRIQRFRNLRNYRGKVFFIRNFTTTSSEQAARHPELAQELKNVLRRYFPDLDFTLVIVTYNDVGAKEISGIDQVLEFRMERHNWIQEYTNMYKALLQI